MLFKHIDGKYYFRYPGILYFNTGSRRTKLKKEKLNAALAVYQPLTFFHSAKLKTFEIAKKQIPE